MKIVINYLEDAMSTDKLTDGIRRFASDLEKLEDMIR